MKTTEPLEEFSKGTTPWETWPDWTAAKTSSIVVKGWRVYWEDEKWVRVACVMEWALVEN